MQNYAKNANIVTWIKPIVEYTWFTNSFQQGTSITLPHLSTLMHLLDDECVIKQSNYIDKYNII